MCVEHHEGSIKFDAAIVDGPALAALHSVGFVEEVKRSVVVPHIDHLLVAAARGVAEREQQHDVGFSFRSDFEEDVILVDDCRAGLDFVQQSYGLLGATSYVPILAGAIPVFEAVRVDGTLIAGFEGIDSVENGLLCWSLTALLIDGLSANQKQSED